MQTTDYFVKKLKQADYQHIKWQWIESTYCAPEFEIKRKDGRINLYRKIAEMNNLYLKLTLLKDGKTVKDAYFTRHFQASALLRHRRIR